MDDPSDRPTVTVCGLGPGGLDRLTDATRLAIETIPIRFVRTRRHPSVAVVGAAESFDDLYDRADSFEALYRQIADTIADAARDRGEVLYAVPGSPLVLEASVRHLRADDRVRVRLVPALSFLDEVWARLGIDPVEESVRLVDGYRFAVDAAGERGPLVVAHVHDRWLLSDIKLAIDAGDEQRAIVLQRLGTPEESITEVAWPELDRVVEPDHLTTLYLPDVAAPVSQELARSVELMNRLRRECPWDREQDHATLRPHLVEEAYEVLDAIDGVVARGDGDAYGELEEELGDLWFQILFHAELAGEAGQFTIADVARGLYDKMVRRHPHVFEAGHDGIAQAVDTVANWDRIKGEEKDRPSALDGIPTHLPALAFTAKMLSRAERAGTVADGGSVGAALDRLVAERGGPGVDPDHVVGEVLLAAVTVARRHGVDPEEALRAATRGAMARFLAAESSGRAPSPTWVLG